MLGLLIESSSNLSKFDKSSPHQTIIIPSLELKIGVGTFQCGMLLKFLVPIHRFDFS